MRRISLLILMLATFSIIPDANAEMLWSMSYDDEQGSWGCTAHLLQEGDIVITGYIVSHPQKMSDVFLIKSDTEGNIIWTRTVKDGDSEISLFGELPASLNQHLRPLGTEKEENTEINPAINNIEDPAQNSNPVIGIMDNMPPSDNITNTYMFNLNTYWNKFTDLLNLTQNNITSLLDR